MPKKTEEVRPVENEEAVPDDDMPTLEESNALVDASITWTPPIETKHVQVVVSRAYLFNAPDQKSEIVLENGTKLKVHAKLTATPFGRYHFIETHPYLGMYISYDDVVNISGD